MKRFPLPPGFGRLGVLTLVGLLSACGGGSGTDPVEDDLVVGGLVVRSNGVGIASVLGTLVTGELQGEEGVTSALMSVSFVDDEGVQFTPFANENMSVTIADESIATFLQEGTFTGRMVPVLTGETTATIRFVQDGVAIYTSPPIPVSVTGPI